MKEPRFELADAERDSLRAIVATIDREMSSLSMHAITEDDRTTTDELFASWAQMVKLLALGQAPEIRECSACRQIVTEVCGESVVQRSWFRIAPCTGLCTEHRERAKTR